MMVGLPGSGKSTYARKLAEKYEAVIHSSDEIRNELFGDENIQDDNNLVFNILHKRIKEDLKNGVSVIYDACNISYKRRKAFLRELMNIECGKDCILVATSYEDCLERNKDRDKVVPDDVITKMYKSFHIPYYYEGWDKIEIKYMTNPNQGLIDHINQTIAFNQDSPHHALSLGMHSGEAVRFIGRHKEDIKGNYKLLGMAAILHDCGKPFCKTFVNTKGETTDIAHYYSHEHVGAYNSLFYMGADGQKWQLRIAAIIQWHMMPYIWEKDDNKKLMNKYLGLWGEELFDYIMIVHKADIAAH